jgi:CheY-like chemotaxis protein
MPLVHRAAEILVVEDSPVDIRLISEALEEAGALVRIHIVEDGDAALAFLTDGELHGKAPRPDLILLDLNLPRRHGLEVLAEIRSDPVLRPIPVVVLSSSSAEGDVFRSYELCANSYVTKSADPEEFSSAVREICRYWLQIAQLPVTRPGM